MGKSLVEVVSDLMEKGLTEEAACKEVFNILYPEQYDPDDSER